MAHDMHEVKTDFIQQFRFKTGLRKTLLGVMGAGLLFLILGIAVNAGKDPYAGGHHGHHEEEQHHEEGHGGHEHGDEHSGATQTAPPARLAAQTPGHGEASNEHHDGEAHHGGHGESHAAAHPPHGVSGPYWLNRLLVNLLQNSFFFMGLGLLGIFFIAVNYASNAGWFTLLKRIPGTFTRFIPIGWGVMMLIFGLQLAGVSHIYPWTDASVMAHDDILASKTWWLNVPFMLFRQVGFLVIFLAIDWAIRKASLQEDNAGGHDPVLMRRQRILSSLFLVLFAIGLSIFSFDWLLSLDAHWFSTMYAVHVFASLFVSMLAGLTLLAIYLKTNGFMPQLNQSHFHDLGKFVFGFSIFWTYIWFGEFLLIWYANLPEETFFFKRILDHYPFLFTLNLVLNFLVPLLGLMTNTSKRRFLPLGAVCAVVFLGHWIDFYLLTAPTTLGPFGGLGLIEIGTYLLFGGGFALLVFRTLTKTPLVPVNHPYLQESLQHSSM